MAEAHTAQNADKEELARFEAVAAHWWDVQGPLKTLHGINPLRLQYIQERAPLAGRQVLDIGCGGGILSEAMSRQGAIVTGIDLAHEALLVARMHAAENQVAVDYQEVSAEDLANTQAGSFDVVTCLEMLEHVPDPAAIVHACGRLVKPQGHVFFSTINRSARAWLTAVVAAEYMLKLIPRGTHEYARLIRPSELAKWVRDAGLTLQDLQGVRYLPFLEHYALTSDVDVNYLVHAQRL